MPTEKSTVESYNKYAEKWAERRRTGTNIAHLYIEKPAMYAKIPDVKNKTVLCIGCGTGEECAHLKSLGAKVIGIDISEELIKLAKKNCPDIEFHTMDMENLDFPDATFDFIYSSLALHYVEDWKSVLKSTHRVLKKGQTFLFSTHHPVKWGGEQVIEEDTRSITRLLQER